MKKVKLTKEEKEKNKFKKYYEKIIKAYGEDTAHTILSHIINNGVEIGSVTVEEKNVMLDIMKGVEKNEY